MRIALLLDCLAHALDTVPGTLGAVSHVMTLAGVHAERWPDGGLTEPWVREELELASAALKSAASAWQLILIAQGAPGA